MLTIVFVALRLAARSTGHGGVLAPLWNSTPFGYAMLLLRSRWWDRSEAAEDVTGRAGWRIIRRFGGTLHISKIHADEQGCMLDARCTPRAHSAPARSPREQ